MHELFRGTHAALLLCALLGLARIAAAEDASQSAPQPAYWAEHQEVDELDHLPKPYKCDDLFYKYRDILLRLGARPGIKIYTYGCVRAGHAAVGVPKVDLGYAVPRFTPTVTGLEARRQSVRLAPGEPKSLTADDCALLDDMRQTVIAAISSHIDDHAFDCGSKKHFELVVETLVPLEPGTK